MTTPSAPVHLTPRQAEIYAYLREHLTEHGHAPSVREIAAALGISSTSVVNYHLRQLAKAGRIVRTFGLARGIDLVDAMTVFAGDELVVEVDGQLVVGRVVEPATRAA